MMFGAVMVWSCDVGTIWLVDLHNSDVYVCDCIFLDTWTRNSRGSYLTSIGKVNVWSCDVLCCKQEDTQRKECFEAL